MSICLGWATPAALADAAAGRAAYDRGDYARALADWQSAADTGDPEAEFGLGSLYEFGLAGLQQDYKQADHWYQLAAAQDYGEAAYRLALIWAVGGAGLSPDPVEAYKWVALAVESKGVWGTLAEELRTQLNRVVTAAQQAEAKQHAAAWRTDHTGPKPQAAPVAAPVVPANQPVVAKPGGCPGWPFPTLPCTEQFPALRGVMAPAAPSAAIPPPNAPGPPSAPPASPPQPPSASAAPAPPVADPKVQLAALNDELGRIDCASLAGRLATSGTEPVVTGTAPDADAKARLTAAVQRHFPNSHPQIDVAIVPPPLCRALAELGAMRRQGLLDDGDLRIRLVNAGAVLHEGDPIKVEVHAPSYGVNVRIDYFSLDGQVQHLWPNDVEPQPKLAAGAVHVYGEPTGGKTWKAGGAPFGTEQISVIATPQPLDLGDPRPVVEQAATYLRDVMRALTATHTPSNPNVLMTMLVTTHSR